MLKRLTLIAGVALFLLTACNRLSPDEQKVVGTWEAPGGFGPRCIFNKDHTSAVLQRGADGKWMTMSEGRWRLEGNNIVEDYTFISPAADPGATPQTFKGRTPVIEFHQDRLVMETLEQSLFRVK